MSNSTSEPLTDAYLDLVAAIGAEAPHARHHVERLPAGQIFRSFPSCAEEGPFIAAVTDVPVVPLEFSIGSIDRVIFEHFHTGRGYGQTPHQALNAAWEQYLRSVRGA